MGEGANPPQIAYERDLPRMIFDGAKARDLLLLSAYSWPVHPFELRAPEANPFGRPVTAEPETNLPIT
jgi:hypothetical protein